MFSIRPGVKAQILPSQTSGQTEAQIHPASSLTDRPRGNPALECAAAFLLILAFMAWIQFAGPAIVGNDAYYHIRWSRILRESLPHLPAFKSLPLTVLRSQLFVDQHFLFHVSLIPFTFGDLRLGAKLAAPLFSAIAMTSVFGLLVVYRIRHRWLWLLALAGSSEPFLYRMSMTRAPSLSLLLLAVGVYLILERRWVSLAVLTFVFVWLYNMFPLILAFAFLYAVTVRLSKKRIDLAALYATSIGAVLGLVINPYFPKDLLLIFHHVHMLLAETVTMDVGSEWYPFDTWEMLTKNAALFALCFAALLAFDFRALDFRKGARDRRPLFFLLLSAMFLLMTFRWRRFVEYWPPFAVLFAAFTLDAKDANGAQDVEDADDAGHTEDAKPIEWPAWIPARLGMGVLVVALGAAGIVNAAGARAEIRDLRDPFAMRGASAWLADHTLDGSLVFNTDWVEFPELFYYDQRNGYATGLDPRYLFDAEPDLWKVYDRITQGEEKHPGPLIRERFGAEYVVARSDSTDFLDAAKASGDFDTVYSDKYASVLRVR
jgi:hypothetical protein